MSNAPAIRVQAITGWILIAHENEIGWYICWHDVFGTKKTALKFAETHKWPPPYRAVRGRIAADQR